MNHTLSAATARLGAVVIILSTVAILGSPRRAGAVETPTDHQPDSEPVSKQNTQTDLRAQQAQAKKYFSRHVAPFIRKYCLDCHSSRPAEGGVNFEPALKTPGHPAFTEKWKQAVARVKVHDMPPEYEDQPSDEQRETFLGWLQRVKYLSEKDPGPFVIRRLTKTEFGNTLHDLFGVDPAIVDGLPAEVSGEGYLNSLSPLQLEQYLMIAKKVVDQVFAPEGSQPTSIQRQLFGEKAPSEFNEAALAEQVAASIAKRAYRRPASPSEVETLLEVYELGRQNGLEHAASLRLMLQAILVSPQFLFITPAVATDSKAKIVPLDDYQLASRLSYFLWATLPDEKLLSLAERGTLHEPAVLKSQINRLLDDPRSRSLFDGFGAQWLRIDGLKDAVFDTVKFPQMTDELRAAMVDEARLFFQSVVRENGSVERFIESDYTFVNEYLASIYEMESTVTGPEMRRVHLTNPHRGGVLGMPGILAATSFPNRTSPVKRGVWVLEQVLGDHVPSAPPDVPALEKQGPTTTTKLTLRERTELHRTDPVCANCHQLLDPIGFGLENFDAIGRWRDRDDNGERIDATGELPSGKRFSTPKELKSLLTERTDDVARNLVEKLLAYALCRGLEGYDEIVVDDLMRGIADDGYRLRSIIVAVIMSYPFTHRRIQE